jgi:molybdopterin molybdotransferase
MTAPMPVEEHLQRVLERIQPLVAYEQRLAEVQGLPVAQKVVSPLSLPVFDNSAMDGYAVHLRDVVEATPDRPVHLPVTGNIAAGDGGHAVLQPGTTMRIMTGARVPEGCTAVVPLEWTDNGTDKVLVHQAPTEGQHVRRAGEDVRRGDVLLREGDVVGPRQVGLLASVGLDRVVTRPRPRVVIMSTGSELVEPGLPLGPGQIHDSNSYLLAAAARAAGAIPYRVNASADDVASFTDALSDQLVRADVVVTSGGVSKGDHDVVKAALRSLRSVDFREVAMQPGKPQGFGLIGEDATPIFTLPGNPVSSYISVEVFVVPALRKMIGRRPWSRPVGHAVVSQRLSSPVDRTQYLRGRFDPRADGAFVEPVGGPGSHLVGGLAAANCLIVLDEGVSSVAEGDVVPVMLLDREY